MKKHIICVALILVAGYMVSCSSKEPACEAKNTKQQVIQIVLDQTRTELENMRKEMESLNIDNKAIPEFEDIQRDAVFQVQNVRARGVNEDTGAYQCAAELAMEFRGEKNVVDIMYTAEPIEGQNGYSVSMEGLSPKEQ